MENKVDEKTLEKSAEHIKYEIDMLKFSVIMLRKPNLDQMFINSFLEIFAIHARNLYFFFYENRKLDDIIAEDFINDKKTFQNLKTPKEKLKIIKEKTGKQIAHITYFRIKYTKETKLWEFYEIYIDLEKTIKAFIKTLPQKRKSWFL